MSEKFEDKAVKEATVALQSQERLVWMLRHAEQYSEEVKEKARCTLDSLRSVKAAIEGSDVDFKNPVVYENGLIELKQLTLMHIPSSLTPDVRERFRTMVEDAFKDQCKAVISITLLTCPWYEVSQRERGEQAKHNILLVVYVSHDDQFFSPVNPQVKEKASVIDFGWMCGVELSHFGQALARGRTRYMETVFCRDGAEIYSSESWHSLKSNLHFESITGTRGFLEAALGQAVGGVGKKRKTGDMKLKEGSSIFEICESFRLLQHADNALKSRGSISEVRENSMSEVGILALEKVGTFYDHKEPLTCKQELFSLLMAWADELRALSKAVKGAVTKSKQTESEKVIGEWLMEARLQGQALTMQQGPEDRYSELVKLMQDVGGPVAKLQPEQILLVAVAGSAMYNLNTPTSDVDYLVIYANTTENLLSATKKLLETHESRGLDKDIEYGAYEARSFCEMLLKCSVVILEELAKHRKDFVTEKTIQQYLGLIKNNFKMIERGKLSDEPKRDRKLFYQIFHKLHSIKQMMDGEVPEVRVEGDVRDYIMKVRTQDEGEFSRASLLQKAKAEYAEVRERLGSRTRRLRENPDYTLCTHWLLKTRGLTK